MSANIILVEPKLAQVATPQLQQLEPRQFWMSITGTLFLVLVSLGIYSKVQLGKLAKQKRFEEYKNRELQSKLKLALSTISKMEKNPDLIHSREFNLDYLRMRMEETQFHFIILNQIKIKVKEKITIALRPHQAEQGTLGIASSARQVDEIFDVEYNPSSESRNSRRVLFRIQIKLAKLPTQPSSVTINQMLTCIGIKKQSPLLSWYWNKQLKEPMSHFALNAWQQVNVLSLGTCGNSNTYIVERLKIPKSSL
jgi:hypothetical protein